MEILTYGNTDIWNYWHTEILRLLQLSVTTMVTIVILQIIAIETGKPHMLVANVESLASPAIQSS